MTAQYTIFTPKIISQNIRNGKIIYHTGTLPPHLTSFEDALNPKTWASHYLPFSAVILHDSGSEFVIIRDHLGMEPIYYTEQRSFHVYAASNLPDLFSLLPKTPSFDEDQIIHLFSTTQPYSDHTLYQGVFRVEPGHFLHFSKEGKCHKKTFWALTPQGEPLYYKNSKAYVEHFSMLLKEAIIEGVPAHASVACEYSAGLDSTSVYCAAHECGLRPKLFMHGARKHSEPEKRYQTKYESAFLEAYPEVDIERVVVNHPDILGIFDEYASWFKGPAPYLFFMFAHPIHEAVSRQGHTILLSGFGGDQGVSSPIPLNFILPEMLAQKNYKAVWEEIVGPRLNKNTRSKLKSLLTYATYLSPKIHRSSLLAKKLRAEIYNLFHHAENQIITTVHPYTKKHYQTLRHAEYALLQGEESHEIRMRIEYSSLVSKKWGFEYRYPLLHPKLLEFFLSIPLSEKRHQHSGRYLIRRYLKEFFPDDIYAKYLKREGLDIVPSMMTHYQEQLAKGTFNEAFQNLPYQHLITPHAHPLVIRHNIKGYMLKPFHSSQ